MFQWPVLHCLLSRVAKVKLYDRHSSLGWLPVLSARMGQLFGCVLHIILLPHKYKCNLSLLNTRKCDIVLFGLWQHSHSLKWGWSFAQWLFMYSRTPGSHNWNKHMAKHYHITPTVGKSPFATKLFAWYPLGKPLIGSSILCLMRGLRYQ